MILVWVRAGTVVLFLGAVSGCDGSSRASPVADAGAADSPVEPSPDPDASAGTCNGFFGAPNDRTGLSAEQCTAACHCNGLTFAPPEYAADVQSAIGAKVLLNPFAELTSDPYQTANVITSPGQPVCGYLATTAVPNGYRLETFESPEAASDAGAVITHYDACGVCSPLTNLLVYMRHPDLTAPVRECGISASNREEHLRCLEDLGFDTPCAQIWYFNTLNTKSKCLAPCLAALRQPYHEPDGALNPCLFCDETESGPVFKAVAGRTRRNTGLPSSMCRPCTEVKPVFHDRY